MAVMGTGVGILRDAVLKRLFAALLRLLYRVEVSGARHLEAAGPRAVVVVNHVSLLDAVLMAAFLPAKPIFAINTVMARRRWVKPFLSVAEAWPLDPASPMSAKRLIRAVRDGRTCVIFPEGRITVTGALMKIYDGPGLIADRGGAPVVPVRIDGAQFTPFSRLRGKQRLRWFPPITITILPPRRFQVPPGAKGRARRHIIGSALYDIMSEMMFETAHPDRTLFTALLDTRRVHGGHAPAAEDIARQPLSYDRLVSGSLALGRVLARHTVSGAAVGLLLPNAAATAVAFFALQAWGRVPAMLNFTAGADAVVAACSAAGVRVVVSSRRFIEQARLATLAETLAGTVRLLYLEDIRADMRLRDVLFGLGGSRLAAVLHRRWRGRPGDPAVILFTSGSEGAPKGVVLSHRNILSNCAQLAARVAFTPSDSVFNALPVFHAFGLTGGMLLPMLSGIKCILYPSPLHFRIVPEMVYDTNATIMFGTDTFLAGYARAANAYDFYSVRYVFAGAEAVRDETRQAWMDKFGLRILEGYGTTETAPVLAVNTPMHFRPGTLGRLLPGIRHRLEGVPGIAEGGRLWVKGPNVMLGYVRAGNPGTVEPPAHGWYDTGDIVTVDEDGYVRIVGRAKRFAKVAGEMVALGKVEAELTRGWPDAHHAVVAVADARKGEKLVLVTDGAAVTREAVQGQFHAAGLAELLVPKAVLQVTRLPRLGSGKTDYRAVQAMAEAFVRGASAG
jgi:acyl-[acyl-carrier-protein]-phospholipid O-acyltransferase/long-chain-fatty-acid--[acyl-carrier-protein] ligase